MNNPTPMRLVIVILGLLASIALIGAIGLIALEKPAPDQLWMIVAGAVAALGALLAQPSRGDTRAADSTTTTIETPSDSTVSVEPPK